MTFEEFKEICFPHIYSYLVKLTELQSIPHKYSRHYYKQYKLPNGKQLDTWDVKDDYACIDNKQLINDLNDIDIYTYWRTGGLTGGSCYGTVAIS